MVDVHVCKSVILVRAVASHWDWAGSATKKMKEIMDPAVRTPDFENPS